MKNNFAFTLAETLIVIGVIGIVAALTLPNLNQSTGNKEKVAKVKKFYQNISDAFGRAEAIYGPLDEWVTDEQDGDEKIGQRVIDFLKISKNCKESYLNANVSNGCFRSETYGHAYSFILNDGMSMFITTQTERCNDDISYNIEGSPLKNFCAYIYVDIDGPNSGKGKIGYDVFEFYLAKSGVYPFGTNLDNYGNTNDKLKTNCIISKKYCAGWIIETNNMDYLKADSSGKCPNGTVLTWTNTTCN